MAANPHFFRSTALFGIDRSSISLFPALSTFNIIILSPLSVARFFDKGQRTGLQACAIAYQQGLIRPRHRFRTWDKFNRLLIYSFRLWRLHSVGPFTHTTLRPLACSAQPTAYRVPRVPAVVQTRLLGSSHWSQHLSPHRSTRPPCHSWLCPYSYRL